MRLYFRVKSERAAQRARPFLSHLRSSLLIGLYEVDQDQVRIAAVEGLEIDLLSKR